MSTMVSTETDQVSETASVRDAAVAVWRRLDMTRVFTNPGSTEIGLLAGLPQDLEVTLALHEGSVVGMATGYALARQKPALVVLHTTAGLGNAVGALATARVNRAPLVVLVGQQDRRHLAAQPFLAGRLDGLAGEYPVWRDQPVRPQDVPGAIARAWHEARAGAGPAIVVVPMDDWEATLDPERALPAPTELVSAAIPAAAAVERVMALLGAAERPCLVVGAGADHPATWRDLEWLAERLGCPVWQESFGARAGFRQDHPRFAGHLPARRRELRAALAGHDLVLVVGAPVFRQYQFDPGPFTAPETRIVQITAYADEALAAPADVSVLADPAVVMPRLRAALEDARDAVPPAGDARERCPPAGDARERLDRPARLLHGAGQAPARPRGASPPAPSSDPQAPPARISSADLYAALGTRLPSDTILVEESPSTRLLLSQLIPARQPLGFLSAAMGGLGFALPAAVGLRLADPSRPVVAVVGDGSAMYAVQALWSAAHYRVGGLFVIVANGRYAIMDRLAREAGEPHPPWPAFTELRIATIAAGLGCAAEHIESPAQLNRCLDSIVPGLAERRTPMLLDVAVID